MESVPYYNLKVYNTDLDGKETVESIRDDMSQQIMEASQWPLFDIRVSICQDKNIVHVGIDNLIWTQEVFCQFYISGHSDMWEIIKAN